MKFFEALNSRVIALILKKTDAFEVLSIDCGDKGAGIKTSTGDISLLLVFQSVGTFDILPPCNGWLDLCSRVESKNRGATPTRGLSIWQDTEYRDLFSRQPSSPLMQAHFA